VQVILPDTLPLRRDARRALSRSRQHRGGIPGKQHRAGLHHRAAPSRDLVYGTDHPRPRNNHSPIARLRVERPGRRRDIANVWTDGRLNPYRGIRTVEGDAQMRMVWTDTVPRRLVAAD
jgi:hypothetical protein